MAMISIPVEDFARDETYRLVREIVHCPDCGTRCTCEGYNGHDLIYRCPNCHDAVLDPLDIDPLFAKDTLEAAAIQHYEITCPYCGKRAPLVGGSSLKGLFFACEEGCHKAFTRFIRRY